MGRHDWLTRLRQLLFARPPRKALRRRRTTTSPVACHARTLEPRLLLAAAYPELINPNPSTNDTFGNSVTVLSNGNIVVTSTGDDFGASNAGAVYVFNGQTGALISTLRGSTANDNIGSGGIIALNNGNFLVLSPNWDAPGATGAGAVTWVNGMTGLSGTVSAANSLVGSTLGDGVGSSTSVTVLANGNYVVTTAGWDNGSSFQNVGAVTWGNGSTGISGTISSSNSLIGSTFADTIGQQGIVSLSNGNYVVVSTSWDNGVTADVGAVTWANGTTGLTGTITSSNSLIGSSASDAIGNTGVTALANGNYVVRSRLWNNVAMSASDAGAVTFGNGTTGIAGTISSANSLVGDSSSDQVGSTAITLLANGNYVITSSDWDDAGFNAVGAVTFGSATTGVSGVVSAVNSLVGSSTNDLVGQLGVIALTNGNYVVRSHLWNNTATSTGDVGAVTWGNGTTGRTGVISSANSLIGSTSSDQVGSVGVTALANGHYVVRSPLWDNGAATNAGAVTWGSGTAGVVGTVTSSNSLVGSTTNDAIGANEVTELKTGHYIVRAEGWDNGTVVDAGAVTWGNGTTGRTGAVSSSNSLVGSATSDNVGIVPITVLANGNYVVRSYNWDNGATFDAGAVTWGNGTTGITGAVSASNSLIGGSIIDQVGSGGVFALTNGNYVVSSFQWNNGTTLDVGAVTFGNGTTGITGLVSTANSLHGTKASDSVGTVVALTNGSYVVRSQNWDNGTIINAGAVTWGNGTTGITGAVSVGNSIVGGSDSDFVGGAGGVTPLSNGNFVVTTSNWHSSPLAFGGAITFGNGTTGTAGVVSAANSLVGTNTGDLGSANVTALNNGNYVVRSQGWDSGLFTDAGAVIFGNGLTGASGLVSAANSVIGLSANTNLTVPTIDSVNGQIIAGFPFENGGGHLRVGSLTTGFANAAPKFTKFGPANAAGSEFRVNTYTTGAQEMHGPNLPASRTVAMDAAGNYVVVWSSAGQDGSNDGVYAQRYNAQGVAQGSEFLVNTYTTGFQNEASVAMDATGNFVVTWTSINQQPGTSADIYARRYNAAGEAQGLEFRVNTYTTSAQVDSSIAMDADGDFVVTWGSIGQDGSNYGIYAQRFNAFGTAQGSQFRVNTYTTNAQRFGRVAMDVNGDFVVVWNSYNQVNQFDVFAQRYSAAGAALGGEFQVNTQTAGNQFFGNVAMDDSGDFIVTWSTYGQGDGSEVYAQRYDWLGAAVGGEFRVNSYTTGNQGSSTIAMDANGDFVVSWFSNGQDGDNYGVYAQRFTAAGAATGAEFRVNTYTTGQQHLPAIAMNGDGDFVVAWRSLNQDGDGYGVYAQRYSVANLNVAVNTLAEDFTSASPLLLATFGIKDDHLGTESITLTGDDAALFEIAGNSLYLKANTPLDFESNPLLDVTVNVDDPTVGGTPDASVAFTLNITDVNEPTTSVALQNVTSSLDENTSTASAIKLADIVVTDDALGTNVLGLSGTDAASFEIVGSELRLKSGVVLDFETKSSYAVTVNVNDTAVGGTPDASFAFTLTITDVNEPPTAVALQNTTSSLAENTSTATAIKLADIAVTDDALGTNTLSLSGTDAASFEISGSELRLKSGVVLDFETKNSYAVTVNVDDTAVGGTPDASVAFTLTITDINEPPTVVALQNVTTSLVENTSTSSAIKLADIVVTDDALGTNVLSLSGADAASFEIVGSELRLKSGVVLDFETKSSYAVTVNVDDTAVGATPDASVAFTLTITDVNEPPTAVVLQNVTSSLAENTSTAASINLADIAITDDALGTNVLSLSGVDATSFEIVGSELRLKSGVVLDLETKSSYGVRVNVDDNTVGGTPDAFVDFTLTITDVNEAPTAVTLTPNSASLAEDAGTAAATNLATIAVTDDALGTNTLSLSGTDAASFEIVGNQLRLKAGVSLNYEVKSFFDIFVEVNDAGVGATPDASTPFQLTITDVNEAPTAVTLQNVISSLPENASTASFTKLATIAITDDALGIEALTLSGTDVDSFQIVGSELRLRANVVLNFEVQSSYSVRVNVNDTTVGTTPDAFVDFTLSITNVNEQPTDVSLSSFFVEENQPAGTTVGTLSTTDPDAGGSHTYTLVSGVGSGGNANFTIEDNTLKTAAIFDRETASNYFIRIRSTDQGGLFFEKSVNIGVANVNEPPTAILLSSTSVAESQSTGTAVGIFSTTDPDFGGSQTYTLVGGVGSTDNASFTIDVTQLRTAAIFDFETKSSYSIRVRSTDAGGLFTEQTFTIIVTDVNEPPTAVVLQNVTSSLAENASTAAATKLADIVVTDDALGSETLTLSGTDAASFEISGLELRLKAGVVLDFETKSSYSVRVNVDDNTVGGTPDAFVDFTLTLTDVNEPPTAVALQNVTSSLAENTSTASAIKLADIVVTDDALGTNVLSLSGADPASFEIVGSELRLKAGVVLDFETKSSYAVTVNVDDTAVGATPDASVAFSLTISDINEPPTAVALQNATSSLAENTSTASAIKLADIVVTDDALGTNVLGLSGTDAASFEIVGSELRLKAGVVLDFETKSSYAVTVNADDTTVGGTPDASVAFTLNITDVNEAPSVTLQNTVTSLVENTSTSSAIRVADIVVTDDGVGTNTLSLSGADAASFEIVGTELRLKAGVSLNFEVKPSYSVVVDIDDPAIGSSAEDSDALLLTITDENEAPTAILLTPNNSAELAEDVSTATATALATIHVHDDALGTNSLSLSGADASLFEIAGNQLRLKAGVSLDYETKPSYTVIVDVDDPTVGGNPDASVFFTLQITNVNEAPTAVGLNHNTASLAESANTAGPTVVAIISVTDDVMGTNNLSLSGADAASFEIGASQLRLKSGVSLNFEAKSSYNVTVNVDDPAVGSTPDASVGFTLNITDVNEAPTAVALQNVTSSLAENANTASATKLADIVVTDDALGSETLTLSGTDAASFEIVGSELRLKAGVVLDFETKSSYGVRVNVDDNTVGGTPDAFVDFTLTITDVAEGTPVTFLDDGDVGFALTGSWLNVTGYGFGTDARAATGSEGSKKATWTFTGLTAGQYRVEATWLSGSDRADNAPYVIRDGVGGTIIGNAVVNQKNNPAGAPAQGGRPFGVLGTVTITGSTLVVELANTATNGAIIADAIRLVSVTPPPNTPEIDVLDGAASLTDGATYDFGQVTQGATVSKTFTVKNVGTANLLLQPITVSGSAFSLTSTNFTVGEILAPNATTSITIAFNTANLGTFSGGLSFGNNDGDEGPFDLTFSGKVNVPGATIFTLDDGDSGFALSGSWNNVAGYGYGADAKAATGTNGSNKATWTFSGLTAGEYRIAATWLPGSDRANNAPYVIRDGVGGAVLSNLSVNQRNAPSGATSEGGRPFASFGSVTITGTALVIELSNTGTNGAIIADAIRIERITAAPNTPRLDVKDGATSLLDNGTLNLGSATQGGAALTKTITVKNTGTANLILQPITVTGAGFSLVSANFTAGQTLAPNATVDITVQLATTTAGTLNGTLSFGHNDGGPFDLALTGTINVAQPPGVYLIDDGDGGFSLTGSWSNVAGYGYGLDAKVATGSDGTKKATWIFTGLDAGQYRVAATWLPGSDRANNAAYAFKDGAATIGTASVNQRNAPAGGPTVGGRPFSNIGLVTISGNTLTIELANLAGTNGAIIADAIRIEKVA